MEGLSDDGPLVIDLDQCVEVGVVITAGVLFHVDLDNGRCRGNTEHIEASLEIWCLADRIDIAVQILDRSTEEVVRYEPVHGCILVKCIAEGVVVASGETIDVGLHRLDHGIVL